ncbi:hypothetical protein BH11PLA2_BH11PLA2_46260 [soil metagenome]
MSEDDAFLRAIHEKPGDHLTRQIYADFLEERGDPESLLRAEYLRLIHELHQLRALPTDRRRKSIETIGDAILERMRKSSRPERLRQAEVILRLDYVKRLVGDEWWMKLDSSRSQNCVKFRFECPKSWYHLALTGESSVRYCSECDRNVYYVREFKDAILAARTGKCIALDTRSDGDLRHALQDDYSNDDVTMGMLLLDEDTDSSHPLRNNIATGN